MSQDFLSFGLDVSGFSDHKRKKLEEFIALFEKLSKYDGMKITPILGDGLLKFNKMLSETRNALDDINSSIKQLNSSKINITSGTAVQAMKNVESAANSSTEAINRSTKAIKETHTGIESLGKGLTRGLSLLRSIAYILPGIGIAGIFNLAGEAIGEAFHSLGLFNNEEEKLSKLNIEANKTLGEQITLYRELIKLQTEFREENSSQNILGRVYSEQPSVLKNKLSEDILKSRGYSQDTLLPDEIKNAEKRFTASKVDIGVKQLAGMAYPVSEEDAVHNLIVQKSGQIETIKKQAEELKYYEHIMNTPVDQLTSSERNQWDILGESGTKSKIDESKSIIEVAKNQLGYVSDKLKEYYSSKQELALKNAEYEKFLSDETRKQFVNRLKESSSLLSDDSKKRLQDDKNFHDEKLKAINDEFKSSEILNQSNRISITGTSSKYGDLTENPNLSATKVDIENAIRTQDTQNEISRKTRNQKREDNDIEFYQRRIKALTEIDKDEIDIESVKNEKIANNEEKSLSERLEAYNKSLAGKQLIDDRDFALGIQRGASRFGDKTSLTPEEQSELDKNRLKSQYNLQADAEKKVFDIVYSSLKKELSTVLNFNHEVDDANKAAYAKELRENNKRFADKIFQYKAFKENYDAINKKYGVILTADQEEKRDSEDVQKATREVDSLKNRRLQADKEVADAKEQLDLANAAHKNGDASDKEVLISNQNYDKALGKRDAFNKAIKEAEKKVKEAEDTQNADKIKNAKATYEQLIQFEKEYAENKKKIEEGLFNLIKTSIDSEIQHRLEVLALQQKTQDEGYESEISSIEKSSLKAKDKAALDIQLNDHKLEYDKAVAVEERHLKQEAAIADRELAVAHIVWNTAEGVSQALTYPPPADAILAAQRAIIGGIEIATVLAQPIPSYAEGTDYHPGGTARYGEAGWEIVKEPYKSPYLVTDEHVSYLPAGTEIIPFKEANIGSNVSRTDDMAPFRWLAKQLNKNKPVVKTTNIIKVDLGNEQYKRKILGN